MIDLMSPERKEILIKRAENVMSNLEACQLSSPNLVHHTNLHISNVRYTLRKLEELDSVQTRQSLNIRLVSAELWMEALAYKL